MRRLLLQRQRKEKPTGAAIPVSCSPAPTGPRGREHAQTGGSEGGQKNRERKGDQGAGQFFGRADTTKPSEITAWARKYVQFCFFAAFRSSFQPPFPRGRTLPLQKNSRGWYSTASDSQHRLQGGKKRKQNSKCCSLASLTVGSVSAQRLGSDLEVGQHSLSLWGAGVHIGDEHHDRAHPFASPAAPMHPLSYGSRDPWGARCAKPQQHGKATALVHHLPQKGHAMLCCCCSAPARLGHGHRTLCSGCGAANREAVHAIPLLPSLP